MIQVYIDADACPVREDVFRVARRHCLKVFVVSNCRITIPSDFLFENVLVKGQFDAADDWIAGQVDPWSIVITSDIPLADRCLRKKARVLDPKGKIFLESSIGDALAGRELNAFLREMGEKPLNAKPYSPRDRSHFLNTLENQIQALYKLQRMKG